MSVLVFLAAAAIGSAVADTDPAWRCTARHYGGFLSPSGAAATWPVVKSRPEHLRNSRSILLNTPEVLPGGRAHVMYVDRNAGMAFIEQSAGTAASIVVFGPLPKVACKDPRETTIMDRAHFFMDTYPEDLLAGNRKALAHRYSRQGAIFIGGEFKQVLSYNKVSGGFSATWKPPATFRWQNLGFEKLGEQAIMVTGGFARSDKTDTDQVSRSYAAIPMMEDGELRIRMESGMPAAMSTLLYIAGVPIERIFKAVGRPLEYGSLDFGMSIYDWRTCAARSPS